MRSRCALFVLAGRFGKIIGVSREFEGFENLVDSAGSDIGLVSAS
jgi:hypothetical protein